MIDWILESERVLILVLPTVFLIDKDCTLQDALAWVLTPMGINVKAFFFVQDFLDFYNDNYPACLLLDTETPELTGIEIQKIIVDQGIAIPIIFLSAEFEVSTIVSVMKQGAIDYLVKPCNNARLIEGIKSALALDKLAWQQRHIQKSVRQTYDQLSKREKQVMQEMVSGKSNKAIATMLTITLKTVEAHRASVMKKMSVDSLATLVKHSLVFDLISEEEVV